MPTLECGEFRVWFGTADAPAPSGTIPHGDQVTVHVGVQPDNLELMVKIQYRRQNGIWMTLSAQALPKRGAETSRYYEAVFPRLAPGTSIEYLVQCQHAGKLIEFGNMETLTFEIQSLGSRSVGEKRAVGCPLSAGGANSNRSAGIPIATSIALTSKTSSSGAEISNTGPAPDAVERIARAVVSNSTDSVQENARLDLSREALTLAENDEDAASRLMGVFDRQGIQNLEDLRRFSVNDLTALLGSAGLRGNVARDKARDLMARIKAALPKEAVSSDSASAILQERNEPPSNRKTTSANGIISGIVVRPRGYARLETIEIRAYADPDLKHELGRGQCDAGGRFSISVAPAAERRPAWLRWIAGELSGRSPVFEPRQPDQALRVYPYRLAVHPGSSGHLARRKGRVLASTGRPVGGARIWLVEHALRSCQYVTSTETREDGYFEVAFPEDGLLDPQRPDLRFVVFDRPYRPLLASASADLVLPAESVDARSFFDDVRAVLRRHISEDEPDLAPEEVEYLASRTGMPAPAILAYQYARQIAGSTGSSTAEAFALLSAPPDDDVERVVQDSVRRGIVPRTVLSAYEKGGVNQEQLAKISAVLSQQNKRMIDGVLEDKIGSAQKRSAILRQWRQADSASAFEESLKADAEFRANARFIRHALEIADVTPEYSELLPSLCKRAVEGEGAASFAAWSTGRWREHLASEAVSPPAEFGTGEEGLQAFAGHLAKTFSARYPDDALRALASKLNPELGHALADSTHLPKRTAIVFGKAQSARVREHGRQFQAIESLRAICREAEPVARLLDRGITSSRAIARMDRREFAARFGDAFVGGELDASVAHARARRVAALGNYAFVALSCGTSARGLPPPQLVGKQRARASETLNAQDGPELDSTWEELSGSFGRSFCECAHCRSIFGPAAYLFDMLLFLGRFTMGTAHGSLLQILMERRPDIPQLHLSCDNTNIEVPQIDLVNELLSDLIAASVPEPARPNASSPCQEVDDIEGPIECAIPVPAEPEPEAGKPDKPKPPHRELRCAPSERHTKGTSAERRAIPQNEPPSSVIDRIAGTAFPWILPYDYTRDKATEAERALAVDQTEIALAIWRFTQVDSEGGHDESLVALSRYSLNLSEFQWRLLTMPPYSLADVWGPKVAASVVSGFGPTLDDLRQAGDLDFATLDAALTTSYVSGTDDRGYELLPEPSCDTKKIRLVAKRDILCGILDRLHRFERLRRHLGWSATLLDDALRWLGGKIDEDTLNALGILKFLEAKLKLAPEPVVALFHDPDATERFRLIGGEKHKSSFEELFGTSGTQLSLPNFSDDPSLVADTLVSLISALVGEGPDEVRYVLAQGYADTDAEKLADPANILKSADPRAALRRATSATYRATRFARSLGLSLFDLVHLIETFESDPFPWANNPITPAAQLSRAVRLVTLAGDVDGWHIDPIDVRYVTTFHAATTRSQGLDARLVGQTWLELLATVAEAHGKHKTESNAGRVLLRQILNELLRPAAPDGSLTSVLESTLARLVHLLSWQALLPDLIDQAKSLLPSSVPPSAYLSMEAPSRPPWDVLTGFLAELIEGDFSAEDTVSVTSGTGTNSGCVCPPATAGSEDQEEPSSLEIDVGEPSYVRADQDLRAAAEQLLRYPDEFDGSTFAASLETLLVSLGIRLDSASILELASRYVHLAIEHTADQHVELLEANAQRWAELFQDILRRRDAEDALVAALARLCVVEEEVVRLLLSVLGEPGGAEELWQVFVAEDGSLPRVTGSLPVARYSHQLAPGSPNARNKVWERLEPSLHFDWTSLAPPDGIDPNDFAVVVEAQMPVDRLRRSDTVAPLVIETTGAVSLTLVAGSSDQTVLTADAGGRLERFEPSTTDLEDFIAVLRPEQDRAILRIAYKTAAGSAPPILRLLCEDVDGELIDVWPGDLSDSVLLLHKAARILGRAELPLQIWRALADSPSPIDLNHIPMRETADKWVLPWLRLCAIRRIWSRRASDEQWAELLSIVRASPIPKSDELRTFLGLTHAEFLSILSLFPSPSSHGSKSVKGIYATPLSLFPSPSSHGSKPVEGIYATPLSLFPSPSHGSKPVEGIYATPEVLERALSMVGIARRTALPLTALLHWHQNTTEEQFAQIVGALRAQQPEGEWLEALTTIYDPVREHLRDALLAWLTTHSRTLVPELHDPPPTTQPPFESAEALSDALFTDVQISSRSICLQTSRIQFAYAAVQRYIDAMRMGFEEGPQISEEQDRFEREWSWRRTYRLWEANRRVFVHPENWLEPDLRPEKTELFQQFEDDLMSGPLTSQSAEKALVGYVAKLAVIARPEIIAIVEQPEAPDRHLPYGFRDPDLAGTHVFARTRTQPRKIYYRRRYPLPDGRWTPWEELPVELPGTHYIAVVVFGRVRLLAAEVLPAAPRRSKPNEHDIPGETQISLAWVDRIRGEWSKPSRVARFNVGVPLDVNVDESRKAEAFPGTDVYPDLEWDLDLMNKVRIRIQVGEDGLNPMSGIQAELITATGTHYIGSWIDLHKRWDDYKWLDNGPGKNSIEGTFPSTKMGEVEGIRLSWMPRGGDDCDINRVQIYFSSDSPSRQLPRIDITDGTTGPNRMECNVETFTALPIRFNTGGLFGSGRRCMEAKFKLQEQCFAAKPSLFDWRLIPKSPSVDLPRALYLLACTSTLGITQNYFDIVVRSVFVEYPEGDAATEFKVTASAIAQYPEIEGIRKESGCNTTELKGGWPLDWQTGKDLSKVQLRTRNMDLLRIRVFSDSTTSEVKQSCRTAGIHTGTDFAGQDLVSRTQCNVNPSWSEVSYDVYCSERLAVSAPTCYRLVVPWDTELSSFVHPKVLDENSAELQLGRTFYIERVLEEWNGADKKLTAGGKQCFEVPVFAADVAHSDWDSPDPGLVMGSPDRFGLLNQTSPVWAMGPGGDFMEIPGVKAPMMSLEASASHAMKMSREGGFQQPQGIDKALAFNLAGITPDDLQAKKLKMDTVCVSADMAVALKSVQRIAFTEGIRANQGQMMVAASGQKQQLVERWAFRTFWHPQAVGFLRVAEGLGTPRMLSYGNQALDGSTDLMLERSRQDFFHLYNPSSIVSSDWPRANVDFSVDGAYADYNWELFYHAPLLIAQRLSEAGRFEEAERWFRLLYDPSRGRLAKDPASAYQTFPLRHAEDQRVENMLLFLKDGTLREEFEKQVDRLNRFPYQPHLIARHRISAYQKALFMRYLDHLLAWGDMLFRRAYASDNRTDLETASSRYDLVAKLLGERPDSLPDRTGGTVGCFLSLLLGSGASSLEDVQLWDPVARFAELIDGSIVSSEPLANDGEGIPELYFCVPHNDKLLEYWDTLAERLTNLRTCRDIEGVERTLSLYGRRIDPGLLVRATAQGLDIDVLLGYLAVPLPRFRFSAMLQRAREAADRAGGFGQSLLSTIEKRESEELARLRSGHEIALLRAAKMVRDEQMKDAKESLEALRRSLESAEARFDFYSSRERISAKERAEGEALELAGSLERQAGAASETAADWAWVPNLDITAEAGFQSGSPWYYARAGVGTRYSLGGDTGVKVHQNKAEGLRNDAAAERVAAARLGRQGGFDRRWEDWELQAELARKDIQQIERQITAAEIRIAIAEIECDNQKLQIDNAQAVDAFLRDKFTNVQLYRWMESRLSRLYYQQYRLAYDLAQKTQKALHYELGLEDAPPLPDAWDARNRGMEAATALQHELNKLQQTHTDAWQREHEKTKIFSLRERQPLAFLELRQTGSCVFEIREMDLDEDEPGDYFRRIKVVFVDTPCVRGSDVSVNARLTLLRSTVRTRAHRAADSRYARAEGAEGAEDKRFRDAPGGDHIVTSSGVNDAGLFEPNLNDETWLPFEGAGVVSTWRLDLPLETNHFVRATLSDVKLRILYTSRAGGDSARTAALKARATILADRPQPVMFDLKSWAPDEWHRFIQGGEDGHQLNLLVTPDDLPYALREGRIVGTDVYFEMRDGEELQVAGGDSVGRVRVEDGMTRLTLRSPLKLNAPNIFSLGPGSHLPHSAALTVWVRV